MAVIDKPKVIEAPAGLNRLDSVAIAFFGTWMATGLYLDGWAHIHEKPETFFSPWHGVLYSGFAAAVAFFSIDGFRRAKRGVDRPMPRPMLLGLIIFVVGAIGDGAWHQIFGIEVDLEALLSPTHLALLFGGVLMVTGPFRAAWLREDDRMQTWRRFWPTLVSITLATAVASFFTMYLSAFDFGALQSDAGLIRFLQQVHGLSAVLTTNLILLTPTMLVLKRWHPPRGTFTVMYAAVAIGMVGMQGIDFPLLIIPAVIGGLAADCVGRKHGVLWAGAVVPLSMWTTWFAAVEGTDGVYWPAELIVGAVLLATFSGLVLAVLVRGGPVDGVAPLHPAPSRAI